MTHPKRTPAHRRMSSLDHLGENVPTHLLFICSAN